MGVLLGFTIGRQRLFLEEPALEVRMLSVLKLSEDFLKNLKQVHFYPGKLVI